MVGLRRTPDLEVQVNAQPGTTTVNTTNLNQINPAGLIFDDGNYAVFFQDPFDPNPPDIDIQGRFGSATTGAITGAQLGAPGFGFSGAPDFNPAATVIPNIADPSIVPNRGFVVWDNSGNIFGRQLTSNGNVVNAAPISLVATANTEITPDVDAFANAGSVLVWHNTTLGQIEAQVLRADGGVAVPTFRVDTAGGGSNPAVAALSNERFVVAWDAADVSGAGVHAQIFNAQTGAKIGVELGTNASPLNQITAQNQDQVDVAALSNGNFAVVWRDASTLPDSTGAIDASGTAIRVRVFNSSGTAITGDLLVNTATADNQLDPSITAGPNGGFVVAWTDNSGAADSTGAQDASGSSIKAQAFAADGSRIGGDLLVNRITTGAQANVDLSTGANGTILAVFEDSSGQVDQGGQTPDPDTGIQAVRLQVDQDANAPSVTVSASDTQLAAGETATVTFQFSEAVTGFAASDVTATGGTLSAFTSVDADTYTALFTPNANFNGTGNVAVAAGTYTDLTNNPGGAGQVALQIGVVTPPPPPPVTPEEVYRFSNLRTGGHFFTISEAERDQVVATNRDYQLEGIGFYAFPTDQGAATEEVYRFFNLRTGGHFFTTSEAERDLVVATNRDYQLEGIGFYAFTSDQGAATEEVYRFFNLRTGGHFFTTSEAERDLVVATNHDYQLEGIGFYARVDATTPMI